MEVYLDNSATTRPYEEAAKAVYDTMLSCYGNPSSLHRMGKTAEDLLEDCRRVIAATVYGIPDEIYFTSGGTESDNLALIGYCMANRRKGNRIITQRTEHAAVLETMNYLEQNGFEVVYVDITPLGIPNMEMLKAAIDERTLLLSFMYVNNENGAIFPIADIAALAKAAKCALHVDAVQAYGKLPINVRTLGVDLLTISSHKIHGPNGVGALWVKKGTRLSPVAFGGKQEKGMRSGTENLAGIAGFAKAAEIKFANLEADAQKMAKLKDRLISTLKSTIENVVVNSPEDSVCSVANISFPGVKSEVLLHVLESHGIYVSTGSACNSKKNKFSYVLSEMKLGANVIDSAIRFSFSAFNTTDEIDYVCKVLESEIPLLRKIMR